MVLVSLLGSDLASIAAMFYEFKEKLTHHFLIYDDASYERRGARQLTKGLQQFSKLAGLSVLFHEVVIDEDSSNDITGVYEQIKTIVSTENEIVLHSTQGYAPVALILSNIVLSNGGEVMTYDMLDNEYNLIHGTSMQLRALTSSMDLATFFQLQHHKVLQKSSSQDLLDDRDDILFLFEDHGRFQKVKRALLGQDQNRELGLYRDILEALKRIGIVDEDLGFIPSQTARLQGGLFEEYVFWLCESLDFDDIWLGARIDVDQLEEESDLSNRMINEFDILTIKDNQIGIIECKLHNSVDGLALIYKYDTINDYLGEHTKTILLNISKVKKTPYLSLNSSRSFSPSALRRALSSNIKVYHNSYLEPDKFKAFVEGFLCTAR